MSDTGKSTSLVADFYRNKNVFITGGSGFLGVAIIEKILRSLDVGTIFVLLRSKKGKSINERLAELTKNSVFETLLTTNAASVFDKLVPIEGDVSLDGLGLSAVDRQRLIASTNVVIHSAATLDFNETLRSTVTTNLLGTRRVLELSAEIVQLNAVVHVSSAFVNSFRSHTEEILYAAPADCAHVEQLVRTLADADLIAQTPALLGDHPNTYTFTKHLAEHEVNQYRSRFPCGIVRPSMIQATWKEPVAGWTISKNGAQGFLMGASKGVVRRLPANTDLIADYIPVDTVVNQILVTGQHIAAKNDGQLTIFHCTTSTCNPFRWDLVTKNLNNYMHRFPLVSAVWYPHMRLVSSVFRYRLSAIFLHFIPALFLDGMLRLTGGRPMVWRLHTNIWNSITMLERFIFSEWRFDNARTLQLAESMAAGDRRTFNVDVRQLDWDEYFLTLTQGVRRYLNREHPRNLEAARRKDRILLALHVALQLAVYGLIWLLLKSVLGCSVRASAGLLFAYGILSQF